MQTLKSERASEGLVLAWLWLVPSWPCCLGVEVGCVASCAPCRVVGCVRAGEYERARGSKGERERQAAGLSPKNRKRAYGRCDHS